MNDPQKDDETELKRRFAVELLKQPNEPFQAAVAVFGDDTGRALQASHRWPQDAVVIAAMQQAIEELGDMHFLPTKAQLAREAYNIGTDPKVHVDDRLKAMRLYADIRGYIDKQGANVVVNNLTQNKVMLVRDHGSNEDWETAAAEQQRKLIEAANAPRVQ